MRRFRFGGERREIIVSKYHVCSLLFCFEPLEPGGKKLLCATVSIVGVKVSGEPTNIFSFTRGG